MSTRNRLLAAGIALAAVAALSAAPARAIGYASGDVIYVAYSQNGAEYIVNLGPRTQFLNATTQLAFPNVIPSDLDGVCGASTANLFVALFGVNDPGVRTAVISANGPKDTFTLANSGTIGAAGQIDAWGQYLPSFALAVPSGNSNAGKYPGATGQSYQYILDVQNLAPGSLGNNVMWNVETRLSDALGARIAAPVKIRFYSAQNDVVHGTKARASIGFFTLSSNGTITFDPDKDGDVVADQVDNCPGVSNPTQADADNDHHGAACDCNDADVTVWAKPLEVPSLSVSAGLVSWNNPVDAGGTQTLQFDVFRQNSPLSAATVYSCFAPNVTGLSTADVTSPAAGTSYNYIVSAQNSCGSGTLGVGKPNNPRTGAPCP